MIGETVAHYKILDKLGEGGMGEVWRAEDAKLGRQVAIKLLPDVFTSDSERLARFEREARVLAAFDHPRIASIYGLEDHDGRKLLVMQVAEGETLAERIDAGPVPVDRASVYRVTVAVNWTSKLTKQGRADLSGAWLSRMEPDGAPGSRCESPRTSPPPAVT